MKRLVLIGKALTWISVCAVALSLLCIIVLGAAGMRYEVMAWFYAALATSFVLLFMAGAVLALTPEPSNPRSDG